jgi:hypothetical protein
LYNPTLPVYIPCNAAISNTCPKRSERNSPIQTKVEKKEEEKREEK